MLGAMIPFLLEVGLDYPQVYYILFAGSFSSHISIVLHDNVAGCFLCIKLYSITVHYYTCMITMRPGACMCVCVCVCVCVCARVHAYVCVCVWMCIYTHN